MSDQLPRPSPTPRPRRNPFVTVLLIFVGLILLLPGLCSLIITVAALSQGGLFDGAGSFLDPSFVSFWLICLLIGAGGVALIVFAFRR